MATGSRKPSPQWERRNELARQRGYRNYYDYRRTVLQKTPRDYRRERAVTEANARAEGFKSAKERREYRRRAGGLGKLFTPPNKEEALKYWGISDTKYKRLKRENKKYSQDYPLMGSYRIFNTWDSSRTGYTIDDIGYNIAFHAAIIEPKTSYQALQKQPGYHGKEDDYNLRASNAANYYYLVIFSRLMSQDAFESRYGIEAVDAYSRIPVQEGVTSDYHVDRRTPTSNRNRKAEKVPAKRRKK